MDLTVFLDELNKSFYPQFDLYVANLDSVVQKLNLNDEQHRYYKAYFQSHFHHLLMASPFCHRMYNKPMGYPGDFEMMRMIKEEGYNGPSVISKLINKHVLQNPMAEANRLRINFLAGKISKVVESSVKPRVNILSIASGPALEIEALIEQSPELADRMTITLLDQESEALRFSQDRIYLKRILRNSKIEVTFIHESIGSFLRRISRASGIAREYDLIYIFGLFDYFDDRTCKFCIKGCGSLLNENGIMLLSNYSLDNHHHRTYLEYAFEWYMIYRNRQQLEALSEGISGINRRCVAEDSSGVIKYLEMQFAQEVRNAG
jgi:extracellular factor (EF) 3-hydroxypalmitic acid methyl ester biosynthesis protein